jgi:hypothetical protein
VLCWGAVQRAAGVDAHARVCHHCTIASDTHASDAPGWSWRGRLSRACGWPPQLRPPCWPRPGCSCPRCRPAAARALRSAGARRPRCAAVAQPSPQGRPWRRRAMRRWRRCRRRPWRPSCPPAAPGPATGCCRLPVAASWRPAACPCVRPRERASERASEQLRGAAAVVLCCAVLCGVGGSGGRSWQLGL